MILLKASEMREADEATINELNITQDILMERAAQALLQECLKAREEHPGKILIVAGSGNNGGDGIALARLLTEAGEDVSLFLSSPADRLKAAPRLELDRYERIRGKMTDEIYSDDYGIVFDCLFGVGLNRDVTAPYDEYINYMNVMHSSGAYVISADISSGIDSDTGAVLGKAVEADKTVTFGYCKRGHYLEPGNQYCGMISLHSIGISYDHLSMDPPNCFTVPRGEVIELPERDPSGNKGTFGRVVLVAGSFNMSGAAFLSAIGALYTGAGYAEIITPHENRVILQEMIPEAVLHTYDPDMPDYEEILAECRKGSAVVLGPGLSVTDKTKELTEYLLKNLNINMVVDADALNCIASCGNNFYQDSNKGREIIITPHPGELSRLTGIEKEHIKDNFLNILSEFAQKNRVICVGKSSTTAVTDGNTVYINNTGNDGMGTAGCGDVLSGVIAGLLAQKVKPYDAAWKGVFLHGLAGDLAAYDKGKYSILARDVAEHIPEAIRCME